MAICSLCRGRKIRTHFNAITHKLEVIEKCFLCSDSLKLTIKASEVPEGVVVSGIDIV